MVEHDDSRTQVTEIRNLREVAVSILASMGFFSNLK
jgi:hypothetical protein